MKRMINFICGFMSVFAIILFGVLIEDNVVKAASYSYLEKGNKYSYVEATGSVTITDSASVIIEYKYGIPEAVIKIERCSSYQKNGHTIDLSEIDKETDCDNQYDGGTTIIHVSGSLNATPDKGNVKKTIHLFKQGFSYDEIVRIQVITDFFEDANEKNVEYCNRDKNGIEGCNSDKSIAYNNVRDRFSSLTKDIKFFDTNQLIYTYPGSSAGDALPSSSWMEFKLIEKSGDTYSGYSMPVAKVDNSDFSTETIDDMIYDDIIPVLIGVLIIAAGISVAVLGYQIVKSADEDQERHDKIKRLRNILIGIGIALLLLFAIEPMAKVVERFLE